MSLIEKVAKAIWDDACPGMTWGKTDRITYLGWAEAAIKAMREPTPQMIEVGWSLIRGNLRPDEIYPHMIDAALDEQPAEKEG